MFNKIVMEGKPSIEFSDGGMSMVADMDDPNNPIGLQLKSWDPGGSHAALKSLVGQIQNTSRGVTTEGPRTLRITIEIV